MRPVNLLPTQYRALKPTGDHPGSGYVLLGVLGAVLVGALLYAFTVNQVDSREAEAAEARAEAEEAETRAAALAPYGDFQQVEQARSAAVEELAEDRIDWERLTRELALVLPDGVRLDSLEGSTGAADDQGEAPPPTDSAPSDSDGSDDDAETASTDAATTEPALGEASLVLTGCASSQPAVATTLVRLRRLNGAENVELQDSTSSESGSGGGSAPSSGSDGAAPAAGGTEQCSAYAFSAIVELETNDQEGLDGSRAKAVPARLGGGP